MAGSVNLGKVMVTPKGEYNPEVQYEKLDVVSYQGSGYICVRDTIGQTPGEADAWIKFAEKGETPVFSVSAESTAPETDAEVEQGGTVTNPSLHFKIPKGKDGITPTFKVGTVSGVAYGQTPEVTMTQEENEYALNFKLERGQPGETPEAVVLSVNDKTPDEQGKVTLTPEDLGIDPEAKGTVKSVWSAQPDENGNSKPEVGGRNLLIGTNQGKNKWFFTNGDGLGTLSDTSYEGRMGVKLDITVVSTSWSLFGYSFKNYKRLKPNSDYVASAFIKTDIDVDTLYYLITSANQLYTFSPQRQVTNLGIKKDTWTKVILPIRTKDQFNSDTAGNVIYFMFSQLNKIGDLKSISICDLKLEKGTVPTDWTPAPEDLDETHYIEAVQNHTYEGRDLTQVHAEEIAASGGDVWAWVKKRCTAHDWSGLRVGDYIPFTTTNSVTVNAQIAGIDTYYKLSDKPVPHHIDFISKALWPTTVKMNLVDFNNGISSTIKSPWLCCNAYAFLNSLKMDVPNSTASPVETTSVDYTTTGVYDKLPESLKAVIKTKRMVVATRYSESGILTQDNSWEWTDLGNLWLPSEVEVAGCANWSSTWENVGCVQYPIFANNLLRIKSNSHQWLRSQREGNSRNFALVDAKGNITNFYATYSFGVPVCFRISA